jgi:hypothetical protein
MYQDGEVSYRDEDHLAMQLSAWQRPANTDSLRFGGCDEDAECEICHLLAEQANEAEAAKPHDGSSLFCG